MQDFGKTEVAYRCKLVLVVWDQTDESQNEHANDANSSETRNETRVPNMIVESGGENHNSRSQETSVPRARPQPNRCRQRLNNPLFHSPDPTVVSLSQHSQEAQENTRQSDVENRGSATAEPQKVVALSPRLRYPRSTAEEIMICESQLDEPLQCPVITCERSFHFLDDFEYHKTVCIISLRGRLACYF